MASVHEHCRFNFLHLDIQEGFHAIRERPARIEYIVDKDDTLFPERFDVTVDGDVALKRMKFIQRDFDERDLQRRDQLHLLDQQGCQYISLAVDAGDHDVLFLEVVLVDFERHAADLLLDLTVVEDQ